MKRMQASSFLMRMPGQSENLLVQRACEVIWRDGKPVEVQVKPYRIIGNVQPMNSKDLLLVPEANRTKEQLWIYTEQNEKTPKLNDNIKRGDGNFQVQSVENWGTYSKLRLMRIDVGNQATR